MEIISVVKYGESDQLGTVTFRHDKKRMTLSAKDIEFLYNVSREARDRYVFCEENKNKYPDPSELPEKIPRAKRNRFLYNDFNAGASKEELAKKYGLKPASVMDIVREVKQRDDFYGDAGWYVKTSYKYLK